MWQPDTQVFFTGAIPAERDTAANEINSVLVAMRRLEIRIPDLRKIL